MSARGASTPWWPLLAGVLSGTLYALSLPKADQGWLAWLCLVPVFVLLLPRGRAHRASVRAAAVAGGVAGLVAGLGRVSWVGDTLRLYGGLTAPEAWMTTGLLVSYLALYPLLFFPLCSRLPHRSHVFPWLAASLWALLDWVQTWMLSGFPWALLGYSQYRVPAVVQLAALGGVHAVTFVIVLVNGAVAQAITARGRRRLTGALPALLTLASVLTYGWQRLEQPPQAETSPVRVGVVQGNVGQDVKWDRERAAATTDHYVQLTLRLVAEHGPQDLIVWPETALPFAFDHPVHSAAREQVARLARRLRTPLLVGSLGSVSPAGRRGLYNRSFLVGPDGLVRAAADKVHLVPFGEYLPMRWLFSYLQGLTAESGAFNPGEEHVVLPVSGGLHLGVFICYESIFPAIPRALVLAGADVLVNTTNDAWFGTSAAPYQHFAMAVVRAVETGRTLVRAANTGISGAVSPTGRILTTTGLFETRLLSVLATPHRELTPYARHGDVVLVLGAALLVAWLILAHRRRSRRIRAELRQAEAELASFAARPVALRHRLLLLPGYDASAGDWKPLRSHLSRCFTGTGPAVRSVDLRRDVSLPELASHAAASVPEDGACDFVGHSLGGLVAALVATPGSRVFGLAVPLSGTRFADLARWFRFPLPRLLRDLSPTSAHLAGARRKITGLPGWMGIRLAGDPLTRGDGGTAGYREYDLPALVGPWRRHCLVHADPRVIRDIVAGLRSAADPEPDGSAGASDPT